MSIYTDKSVLVVGTLSSSLEKVSASLEKFGAKVIKSGLDENTYTQIKEGAPDLVILNLDASQKETKDLLNILRQSNQIKKTAVLALTESTEEKIQAALTLGASDYFHDKEPSNMIETKVKLLLGRDNNFEGAAVINISDSDKTVSRKGVRVFAVEDDPLLRNLLQIRFEKSSFPFEFSIDGREVLPAIKKFKPQVIILDLMLPGCDGLDLLAQIKNDKVLNEIPVIIFSNRDESMDRKRSEELGADKFFVKALTDLSEFVDEIAKLAK